jgi:hypothetical protein
VPLVNVPGLYVVLVWPPLTNGGMLDVPKYTLCDVAPEPAAQLRVDVMLTPVAPLDGLGDVAWPVGGGTVVNLRSVPVVVPPAFISSTRQ